ncbi:MAG: hypothetical protein V5A64_05840 [Candidatus Thermoplasmatota archaeon]
MYKKISVTVSLILIFSAFFIFTPSETVKADSYNGEDLANAILTNESWLISSSYTDTDPDGNKLSGVFSSLGTMEPTHGSNFALFSTGIAGTPIVTTNEEEPGDERGSWFEGGQYSYPRDQATLTMDLQVPEHMHYLYYDVQFFSSEYPDYVGSQYNDRFTVTVDSPSQGTTDYVFDVNSGYFVLDSHDIPDTGFDIFARSGDPDGVDWVDTTPRNPGADGGASDIIPIGGETHPVSPGETITLTIDITDVGDNQLDSAGFIDNLMFTGYAKTDIIARKTVEDLNSGDILCGDTLEYTVSLINTGTIDQPDNPSNEFEDIIPENTEYVVGSATATSGTIDYNSNNNKIIWNGDIPAESSVSLNFKVKVDNGLENGTIISNQGEVYWDSNEDGTNDATELTDNPYIDDGIDQDGDSETNDDDPTNVTVKVYQKPSTVTENFDDDTSGYIATQTDNGTKWFKTSLGTTGSIFETSESYHYSSSPHSFKTKIRNKGGIHYWNYTLSNFNNLTLWETWFTCGDNSEPYNLTLVFKDTNNNEITKIKFEYINAGDEISLPRDWFAKLYYWDNGWKQLQSSYTGWYLHNNWYKIQIEKTETNTLKYSLYQKNDGKVDVGYADMSTGSFKDLSSIEFSSNENPIMTPIFFWDDHTLHFE